MYQLDRPSEKNRQSVANVIQNDHELARTDRDYIHQIDDLVAFRVDNESSWVHEIVQFCCKWSSRRLMRVRTTSGVCYQPSTDSRKWIFRSGIQQRKIEGDVLGIDLFQRAQFNKGVEYLFALICIVVLVGPIYLLNYLKDRTQYVQNTAVLGCTALFAFLISSATAAQRHEIFAVTSA